MCQPFTCSKGGWALLLDWYPLIDIDTSWRFASGLFISTCAWRLQFALVSCLLLLGLSIRTYIHINIFNGGIFVVIIGFYCILTSTANQATPALLPCCRGLWLFIRFLLPLSSSAVRVVRQVCTVPAGSAHWMGTSLSLFAKSCSATLALLLGVLPQPPPYLYCIYYYVYLFYINLLLLNLPLLPLLLLRGAPFSGLSIFISTLICYGFFTSWLFLCLSFCVVFIGTSILITAHTNTHTFILIHRRGVEVEAGVWH